jgi:hypothetical protein
MCGGQCVDLQSDAANCSTCGNACPAGGVCVAGQCSTLAAMQFATGFVNPTGIAVDSNNVYITDSSDNSVWQIAKTTGARTELATNQRKPWRIALDAAYVYWTSNQGGAVVRTAIGSTAFQPLYSTNLATGLLVDDTNVYWSDAGGIFSAPKGGGGPAKALSTMAADPLYATRTQIVFIGNGPISGSVYGLDKMTGAVQNYFGATGRLDGSGVAADDTDVFYAYGGQCNATCTIKVCGPSGCDNVWDQPFNRVMVSEPCRTYWGGGNGIVWSSPGAFPERVLLHAQVAAKQLALDDKYVYWTDTTWIGRVPK